MKGLHIWLGDYSKVSLNLGGYSRVSLDSQDVSYRLCSKGESWSREVHIVMAAVPWGHSIHKKASEASIQVGGVDSQN